MNGVCSSCRVRKAVKPYRTCKPCREQRNATRTATRLASLAGLPQRDVFTTGQVARICKVAPRTCGKWFDSGRLKGYRIPGSQDRRIPRDELVRFLTEHGMPLGELEGPAVVVVGDDRLAGELGAEAVPDAFSLGERLGRSRPRAVVLSPAACDRATAARLAARFAGTATTDPVPVLWLCGEDGGDPPAGTVGMPWPHDPAAVRRACGLPATHGE